MKREKKENNRRKQLDLANELDEVRTTEFFPSSTTKCFDSSMNEESYDDTDYLNYQYEPNEDETYSDDESDLEFFAKFSLNVVFSAKNTDIDKITADEFKNCDKAFSKVYEFYRQPLIAYATMILGSVTYAEDVVHDVFLNLFEKRKDMPITSPKELLFRSVKNRCLDILKHEKYIRTHSEQVLSTRDNFVDNNDPAILMEAKEAKSNLGRAIATLPEKYRRIFELAYYKGFSYKEISQELDMPVNSLSSSFIRAKKMLLKILETHGLLNLNYSYSFKISFMFDKFGKIKLKNSGDLCPL